MLAECVFWLFLASDSRAELFVRSESGTVSEPEGFGSSSLGRMSRIFAFLPTPAVTERGKIVSGLAI